MGNKKRIILSVVSAILTAASLAMIVSVCAVKVNLTLMVDGVEIGAVQSAGDVEQIRRDVISDVSRVAYGSSFDGCSITYGFAEGAKAGRLLSDKEIYKAIYIATLKDYRSAYGIYANGEFLAANTDSSVICDAVAAVRSSAQGEDDREVELTGSLEVRSLYYPLYTLRAECEIEELLTERSSSLYRTVSSDGASVVSVNIDASVDEGKVFGAEGGEIVYSDTDDEGVMTVRIRVTETVPYQTEYRRSDELFIGTYKKACDGADGKKEVIYSVTYKDGVPVDREKVSETVILQPVSKIIDEGTKTKPVTASKDRYIWPIKNSFTLTDTFGGRTVFGTYSYHYAIDLAAPGGTPIYAADGGVVTKATYNSSYGYHMIIKHDNGQETLYAHMRSEPFVSVGERVYQGQQIGEVGMTGYATGYHLHFEVRVNGEKVDPLDYLPER